MSRVNRILAGAAALMVAAAPLAAQERAVVVSVLGGGYSQLVPLSGATHFNRGFTVGACGGLELNEFLALHADFAWTRAIVHGDVPFSGTEVSHYFYGAHVEVRAPFERGLVPFAFLGAGAVTVDPGGVAPATGPAAPGLSASSLYFPTEPAHELSATFTRPALTFGVGLFYLQLPSVPVELFFEGKALMYQWDRAGYDRTQIDVTYALGMSYRMSLR